jgi:hypothetical protein
MPGIATGKAKLHFGRRRVKIAKKLLSRNFQLAIA